VKLAGQETKVALFVITLPYSGAIFVRVFARECTETFLEGHRQAFEFFGGVPKHISYDNSSIAVIRVLDGRQRTLTKAFLRLQSCYLLMIGNLISAGKRPCPYSQGRHGGPGNTDIVALGRFP